MVWVIGHYPDCNSGPPCLVVDDYKKKHNFRPSAYVLFKKSYHAEPRFFYSLGEQDSLWVSSYLLGLLRVPGIYSADVNNLTYWMWITWLTGCE